MQALSTPSTSAEGRARSVRNSLPQGGLFLGHDWRISPEPFALGADVAKELEGLGRILLQFYRAVNLLYRNSVAGKLPPWIWQTLDAGKPPELIEIQRAAALKSEIPRVIRPDLLITDDGLRVTELDSVPGGIGLTAWLNRVYSGFETPVIGGAEGMLEGFQSIFGEATPVNIIVSKEAETYRPEMDWVAQQLGPRFSVHGPEFSSVPEGGAAYRFFELFDLANVPAASSLFQSALEKRIRLTPPPKPIFEEKMLFALLWNRNLRTFWRQELGESFLARLQRLVPYSWIVDPAPMPPQAAIPRLDLTDWSQLAELSQKDRHLILKVSGFSPQAWGARGVHLGSDLPHSEWAAAVQQAVSHFRHSPYVLQQYHKPALVKARWMDFAKDALVPMDARARLCPYYFVKGEGDQARTSLGGVLATLCPSDKKIIHGMPDAIMAPCSVV